MQEDVERRTIAISVSAVKLTGQTLAKVLKHINNKIEEEERKEQEQATRPQGRQSVKELINQGAATNSMALDGNTKLFDRVARKFNVDYAFHKTGPGKYLLFFKAGQADAITACFSEYSKRVMQKSAGRPSILKQLQKFTERIKSMAKEPKQRARAREAAHDDR